MVVFDLGGGLSPGVSLHYYLAAHGLQGRPNVEAIRKMLLHIEDHNSCCEESSRVITSLEIEKVARAAELSECRPS